MHRLLWFGLLFGAALQVCAQGMAAPWTSRLYYTGTVGTLPVQMTLAFEHAKIHGSYWYERVPTHYADNLLRDTLSLTGTLKNGAATLAEKTPDDKPSGTLHLTLDGKLETITGTWQDVTKKKTLPVALHAVARFEKAHVVLKKIHTTTDVWYPQFLAPSVPAALNSTIAKGTKGKAAVFIAQTPKGTKGEEPDWLKDHTFSLIYNIDIAWYSPRLISLLVLDFEDTGGMHPNTEWYTFNYAVTAKGFTRLKYTDLFTADSRKDIATFIDTKAQTARRQRMGGYCDPDETHVTPNLLDDFLLTPTAVVFIFSRYAIGAYAEGDYFIAVPYKELAPFIKADGPLGRFLKS